MEERHTRAAILAIAAALLTAAAAYGAVFVLERLQGGLPRAQVQEYFRETRISLSCAVIRQETAPVAARRRMRPAVPDGKRLAAGETAAILYDDAGEYMRASLLLRLRRELLALQCASAPPMEQESLARTRREMAAALVRGDYDGVNARAQTLALGFFPEEARAGTAEMLDREIRSLEAAGAGELLLTAKTGSVWSSFSDGWESLSPTEPGKLGPDTIEAVLAAPIRASGQAGRLITDGTFLLAALTDADTAALFPPGDCVTLETGETAFRGETILLRTQGERAVAVFRCRDGLEHVLNTRVLTAQVVTERKEGLLLPQEALHTENGGCFVYRIAGEVLRREEATLLELLPEGALIASSGLRPGDSVLLGEAADSGMLIY